MRRARGAIWRTGLLPVIAGVAGVLGLLWVVLVAAPPWFVHDRSLEGLKAQNEVRTTLLQGLGGMVLLVGAYFTYRQLQTTREGQITERYTRAIDQLGHAELDVRLGGIYALERIARDSLPDRTTIGEVLTAFVRTHAPWPPRLPGQYVAAAPLAEMPELQRRAPDVQACLTVLGRGNFTDSEGRGGRLDLRAVDLRRGNLIAAHLEHANLIDAHLERANVSDANLEGADLDGAQLENAYLPRARLEKANLRVANLEEAFLLDAHLEGAYLLGANLDGAALGGANLTGANLLSAHMRRAYFGGANLTGADLGGANLERASLGGTNLTGADLGGANLMRASLGGANLTGASLHSTRLDGADLRGVHLEKADLGFTRLEGAIADKETNWPRGFDWQAAGVRVEGEGSAADAP
jgi:uncharacterized protein YjbI with pentapeptide repeats